MQFLSETVVISVTGGIIGIIFGLTCVMALQFLANKPILFATEYIIISVIMSIIIGVLSGVYPAMRAARLDPVDALRYE